MLNALSQIPLPYKRGWKLGPTQYDFEVTNTWEEYSLIIANICFFTIKPNFQKAIQLGRAEKSTTANKTQENARKCMKGTKSQVYMALWCKEQAW